MYIYMYVYAYILCFLCSANWTGTNTSTYMYINGKQNGSMYTCTQKSGPFSCSNYSLVIHYPFATHSFPRSPSNFFEMHTYWMACLRKVFLTATVYIYTYIYIRINMYVRTYTYTVLRMELRECWEYTNTPAPPTLLFQEQGEETESVPLGHLAPPWLPDSAVSMCQLCSVQFTVTRRRHHCRACGMVSSLLSVDKDSFYYM